MKPAPPETAELLHRVRQQLILAQVRIMELEDVRDELAPRLAATAKLLADAQTLADAKSAESGHLAKTLTDLQAQYDHLRHMQHITNEALNETRRQLAEITVQLTAAQQHNEQLQRDAGTLAAQVAQLTTDLQRLRRELDEENSVATSRLLQINKLEAELRGMKASRSWRWTAWLRSLERTFSRRET